MEKTFDFDHFESRLPWGQVKWEPAELEKTFGTQDVLPAWIADMDLKTLPEVQEAIIEAAKKSSLMGEYYTTNGMFSIQTCELVFQFATKEAGSDTFVGQVDGSKLCEQALMQRGYATIALEIQNALTKDMPFLFQAN